MSSDMKNPKRFVTIIENKSSILHQLSQKKEHRLAKIMSIVSISWNKTKKILMSLLNIFILAKSKITFFFINPSWFD